jgi:hypothetical protein
VIEGRTIMQDGKENVTIGCPIKGSRITRVAKMIAYALTNC